MFSIAFVVSALAAAAAASIGPVADLTISNVNLAPDGVSRSIVSAGGSFPGSLITGVKGDNFKLNVIDELTDEAQLKSTTIHWHGFFQAGTNYADGVAFVTQCPITTGNSFLYDYSVPDQAGTFWYHSHLSVQYCDGLRGAMVVYDGVDGVNDPYRSLYDVDDDTTVITLADWYHTNAQLLAGGVRQDSTLINGLGRWGGNTTSTAPLAVISVTKGLRYRLRIVAISCDPSYTFSIDGHDLTIIEVDGVNTTPVTVNAIPILAAQRYSAILNANQTIGNYWIRAKPSAGTFTTFTNGINSAILRYDTAAIADPTTTQQTTVTTLAESVLHPLESPGAPGTATPGGADLVLNLTLGNSGGLFTINGVSYTSPTVPVLLQILSGAQLATDLLPSGSVYTLPLNSVIELNLAGGTAPGGPHPFHLHGHTFDVVRIAGSTTYNFANPVRRDVTAVAAGQTTTIRFETNNPGPWFLHCHIDFHLEAGLAIVFAEATESTANAISPTTAWDDLCPLYDALDSSDL